MTLETQAKALPTVFGFREGTTSVHMSRTMMLDELSSLLDKVDANGKADSYVSAIIDENALCKPTQTTRRRTAKRLAELYALDPACTLFRLLRRFWAGDQAGRPMLAFLAAAARDPLLREVTPFVLDIRAGEPVTPLQIDEHLAELYPNRWKSTTRHSAAQNLASSWAQAGLLSGRSKKRRSHPVATPSVAAFAVAFGYLCGIRGRLLLDSVWTRLLDRSPSEVGNLVVEASRQGWLTYKTAGGVVEIAFPGLLTPQEEKAAHDTHRAPIPPGRM